MRRKWYEVTVELARHTTRGTHRHGPMNKMRKELKKNAALEGSAQQLPWTSSERQVLDPANPLLVDCSRGDQLKIFHHLANRDPKLVRVDDAGKARAISQPVCCL